MTKELSGIATNMMMLPAQEGAFEARVEVVIVYSEPEYQADMDGYIRRRKCSDFRFLASAAGLRKVASLMLEEADKADELSGLYSKIMKE